MSMAMKYAMKKRYAKGGTAKRDDTDTGTDEPADINGRYAKGGSVKGSRCKMAEGGEAKSGLVERIMAKRQPEHPDFDANEFDELELNPPPKDTSSAGNEIGDDSLDDEEMAMDLVSRIMRKRKSA
jgi:hypothetical protein